MARQQMEWRTAQIKNAYLSYPSLFTPDEFGGQRNYKADLIIPKKDKQFQDLFAGIKDLITNDLDSDWQDLENRAKPIKDFDWESADRDDLEDHVVIRTKSKADKKRPVVVDANRQPILDESEIYAGCIVNANVSYGCYKNNFGKGVKFILNGVQKVADGRPLAGGGGAGDPESMFEVIEENDSNSGGVEDFAL